MSHILVPQHQIRVLTPKPLVCGNICLLCLLRSRLFFFMSIDDFLTQIVFCQPKTACIVIPKGSILPLPQLSERYFAGIREIISLLALIFSNIEIVHNISYIRMTYCCNLFRIYKMLIVFNTICCQQHLIPLLTLYLYMGSFILLALCYSY